MEQLQLALVGCGGMAGAHVRGLEELAQAGIDDIQVVACCDLVEAQAQQRADEIAEFQEHEPEIYTDVERMLSHVEDLDAVDICALHSQHHILAVTCLEAGKHVIIEKPLAITLRAGRKILNAAVDNRCQLAVAENYRRSPQERARSWAVASGRIGQPRTFYWLEAGLRLGKWGWRLNSTCKCNRLGSWHRNGQLVYFPWPLQTQLPTEALMGTYHQLTEYQRYQIYALKKAGHTQQSMAATLAVSPSTISRELRRNRGQRGYRPGQAHQKALARRRSKAKATKMTPAVIERIEAGLRQQWSPEQIAGRLAATGGLRLSPQRIYQHIQADRQAGGMLYRHLRHSQKKRKKRYGKADGRGQIKDRVSIDQRPAIVEEKSRIGDWEIDLVMGRWRTGALVSLVERRSRYTLLGKVASKQAEHVAAATIALLAPHKRHTQTITADNGKEFAHHATIAQALDATVYFAHPYHAWERGLNENTNGLIRQYVPKGTALDTLSQAQIHHIMDRLNHRPRKGLAFQTPHEILCNETRRQPKHCNIALTR